MKNRPIKKSLQDIPAFLAGDHTLLREVLHPENDRLALGFSLAWAALEKGTSSLPHRLSGSETYFILSGEGLIHVETETHVVKTGDLLHIPPDALQWVDNTGEGRMEFLCIVSPAWSAEGEVVLDS